MKHKNMPIYWRNVEDTGAVEIAVRKFIGGEKLLYLEEGIIKVYMIQWYSAFLSFEQVRPLIYLQDEEELHKYYKKYLDYGIDPF